MGRMAGPQGVSNEKDCIDNLPKCESTTLGGKTHPDSVKTTSEIERPNIKKTTNLVCGTPRPPSPLLQGIDVSADGAEKKSLQWENVLAQLAGTCYKPMALNDEFDAEWARWILDGFELHHRKGTRFVFEDGTNGHIGFCVEGVFVFSADWESAWLISESLEGALLCMKGHGVLAEEGRRGSEEPISNS